MSFPIFVIPHAATFRAHRAVDAQRLARANRIEQQRHAKQIRALAARAAARLAQAPAPERRS